MSAVQFIGAFIVIGVVSLIAVGIGWSIAAGRRARLVFFEATARRLKGRHLPSGFMTNDRIEFPIAGQTAVAEFFPAGEDNQGRTRLIVPLPGTSPGTLHIVPDGFSQSFLKMFGAQDLEIGDREFDAWYVVKANPESFAARIFSPDRRQRVIAAVKLLKHLNTPTIDVTRDHIRIVVREELKTEGNVVLLAKTAQEFLEFLRTGPADSGIELGEVRTTRDSTCLVCGTALVDLVVRCATCKTPHHSECWNYVGQCSMYACTGKRALA
jgi:hypothetical protein